VNNLSSGTPSFSNPCAANRFTSTAAAYDKHRCSTRNTGLFGFYILKRKFSNVLAH
jgi:hypothetical protein